MADGKPLRGSTDSKELQTESIPAKLQPLLPPPVAGPPGQLFFTLAIAVATR